MSGLEDFFCPFCITTWICDGPHITSKKDLDSYYERANHTKNDHMYACLEEIKKYELEKGLDLQELSDKVKERMGRIELC